MANYENFQSDNEKYTNDRYDIYNDAFESPVGMEYDISFIKRNLHKWAELISFLRWYPDYFYDLIAPENKKFKFCLDQRVFMRVLARFPDTYTCVTRAWGKTTLGVMSMYHVALLYPNVQLTFVAETMESAPMIWKPKHEEIIKFFPYIGDCIQSWTCNKGYAKVVFVNGSSIDTMGVRDKAKGQRRHRCYAEEDELITKKMFDDAVLPVFDIGRLTPSGEDPQELNKSVARFTTSGYKNSDSFGNLKSTYENMINLNGGFVFTSHWALMVYFKRQSRNLINKRRMAMSLSEFKQNYLCSWIGNDDNSLLNISKLMESRQLKKIETHYDPKKYKKEDALPEYYIGVDIARKNYNRTAIVVGKVKRAKSNRISRIEIVNIITPEYNLQYEEQAVIIKKVFYQYGGNLEMSKSRVKAMIIDVNGWGQGVLEEMLKDTEDPETGEFMGSFDTMNTDDRPETEGSPQVIYAMTATPQNNPDVIRIFVDYFEANRVKLFADSDKVITDKTPMVDREEIEYQSRQVREFIDEVANLRRVDGSNNKLKIEQMTKSIDKDRYSAMAYLFYYLKMFEDFAEKEESFDWGSYYSVERLH
jgi:ribonucleoside-diphosphate reductase alpha chain